MIRNRATAAAAATLSLLLLPGAVPPAFAADLVLPRVSAKASVSQTIGTTEVTVRYGRPGVKGRVIWGDLVPYGAVWRTGANEATTIVLGGDVQVEGKALAAGTYSLHTLPERDQWTVIFNKVAEQWGSYDYKPEEDALRVQVKPRPAPPTEWMTFLFDDLGYSGATLLLRWEKLEVPVHIETDTVSRSMAAIQQAMSELKPDDWRTPLRAAGFYLEAKQDLGQALAWAEQSIGIQSGYMNLSLKARILEAQGKRDEAIATAEKALAVAKEKKDTPDTSATERYLREWRKTAGK